MKDPLTTGEIIIFTAIFGVGLFIALTWIALPFIINSHAKIITKLLTSIDSRLQLQETLRAQEKRASYSKCKCVQCGQAIEFQTVHAGSSIPCPHCHTETILTA